MKLQLKADLDYVLKFGPYKGNTVRLVINKDPSYMDNLRYFGRIKLTSDALCHLINKRTEKLCKLSKFSDMGRD